MITKIKGVKKLITGIRRYGFWRTTIGLFSFLKYKVLKPQRGVISTITDGLSIHFNYPSQFMPTLVIFRELVEPEYEFLRQILNEDSVFFDVGGGIGNYSVFAAKLVNGLIYNFEPVEENVETIKDNLKANFVEDKVQLNAIALSNKEGFGRMQKNTKLLLSRLSTLSTDCCSSDSIEVSTLDLYCFRKNIEHIDVLKIDVEGHEPAIIEGAQESLIKKKIDIIILELNPKLRRFYDSLSDMGFEFFFYDYENNSLKYLAPIEEKNIIDSRPSPFHSNIILIRREIVNNFSDRFYIERLL